MKQTLRLAQGGMLAALSLVLLLLACISPGSGWGLCIAAGMIPAIPLAHRQVRTGLMIYAVTTLLALILVPRKGYAVAYALLFGVYPIVKYFIERIQILFIEWLCKLLYGCILGFVVVALFHRGFMPLSECSTRLSYPIFFCGFMIAFALYDILFSKIIALLRIFSR